MALSLAVGWEGVPGKPKGALWSLGGVYSRASPEGSDRGWMESAWGEGPGEGNLVS